MPNSPTLPFSIFFCLKLILLLSIGYILTPDSTGYIDRTLAINDYGLFPSNQPLTGFRMIGYPLLLYLQHFFFGSYWLWTAIIFQNLVTLLTGVVIYNVASSYTSTKTMPLILSFLYLFFTGFLLYDNAILTDSLNANLTTLVLLLFFRTAQKPIISYSLMFSAGYLWSLAFLIREVNMYLTIPLVFLLTFISLQQKGCILLAIKRACIFCVPIIALYLMVGLYNQNQTGRFYITTGGKTTMMQSVMRAAVKNPNIYNDDTPLDAAARQHLKSGGFSETLGTVNVLDQQGFSDHEISAFAYGKFFSTWAHHPIDMIRQTIKELKLPSIISRTFSPWDHINALLIYLYDQRMVNYMPAFINTPAQFVSRFVSTFIILYFLIGVPWYLVVQWRRKVWESSYGPLWLGAYGGWWGYVAIYSLVHLEIRYLLGIGILPLFFLLYRLKIVRNNMAKDKT